MPVRRRMESCPVLREPPEGFSLSGAGVRPARPEERPLRDALMDGRHCLGLRRPAGRGLRRAAAFRDRRPGLAAWRNGAFRRGPRGRRTGWKPEERFRRLGTVADSTRFLILAEPGVFPNLASLFLARTARRLSGDWLEAHGRGAMAFG